MVNNVLLDINIIMDIFDMDRVQHKNSLALVKKFLSDATVLYVNSDTITTSFYLLRSQKKATIKESLSAVREITNICELITVEIEDIENTLALCEDEKSAFKDYEDALQYVCAKKVGADLIVTNDKNFVSVDIEIQGTS